MKEKVNDEEKVVENDEERVKVAKDKRNKETKAVHIQKKLGSDAENAIYGNSLA
jgi:hypothetical protein